LQRFSLELFSSLKKIWCVNDLCPEESPGLAGEYVVEKRGLSLLALARALGCQGLFDSSLKDSSGQVTWRRLWEIVVVILRSLGGGTAGWYERGKGCGVWLEQSEKQPCPGRSSALTLMGNRC